jgi:hypothetical protein
VEGNNVDERIMAGRFFFFPDFSPVANFLTPGQVHFGTGTEPISADGALCSTNMMTADSLEHVRSPERLRLLRKSPEVSVTFNRFR